MGILFDPSANKTVFESTTALPSEDGDHKHLFVVEKALASEKREIDRKWSFIATNN